MIDIQDIKNLNNKTINKKSDIATLACEIKDEEILRYLYGTRDIYKAYHKIIKKYK